MKIAVVGSGICGLSAARALVSRGHQVELFEQFGLFHEQGSSHGASRIVRRAYPDPFYTACMDEAYPLWHDLEQTSGQELLHECGLLYFGSAASPNLKSVAEGLTERNVPFKVLDPTQVKRHLPALNLQTDEIAVWTPEAGWVNAAQALRTTHALAQAKGLVTHPNQKADPLALAHEYDVVITATGAWTPQFVPIPVQVTLQTYAYIDAQVTGPVWIEDSFDNAYGFPSDQNGLKMGIHRPGTKVDPNNPARNPNPELLEILRQTASRRFGIPNPVVNHPKGCLYTSTANEDFLLGRLAANVFFASACSGHGFKMGPWIGQILANFAEGKDVPENHPRFFFPPPVA